MPDMENYLLSAFFFLLLCGAFYFFKIRHKKNDLATRENQTLKSLDEARRQFEVFNLRMKESVGRRNGLNAQLVHIDRNGLHMEVPDYVSEDWKGKEIDAFFKIQLEQGTVFNVFSSRVVQLRPEYEMSALVLEMPTSLRIEKKRNFIRVTPQKSSVRVIGVWPVRAGNKLPTNTGEIGAPITHYKPGMTHEPVLVENISASGLALRFPLDKDGEAPFQADKGSQLLCLVGYSLSGEENKTVAFWSTGEIMNIRHVDEPVPALVLGLEFTNWAVLEQGANEIHWAHSSPSRGVKPIAQWVACIEQEKRFARKEKK